MHYNTNYITELFIFVDDFFKYLEKTEFSDLLRKWNPNKRGKKKELSISEVVTLNVVKFIHHQMDLKSFYKNAFFYLKAC